MTDAEVLSKTELLAEEVADYLGGSPQFWRTLGEQGKIPRNIGQSANIGGRGTNRSVFFAERVWMFKHGYDLMPLSAKELHELKAAAMKGEGHEEA